MTISKNQKLKQKILDSLKDKAELSMDKGDILGNKSYKLNKKDRRHSGRFTPRIEDKSMKFDEMKSQALEPKEEYDGCNKRRYGYRGDLDGTKLRKGKSHWQDPEEIKEINEKVKKQLVIKKVMRGVKK